MKPHTDPTRLPPFLKRLMKASRVATARIRLLPDFIIIGAARCGTTSLYRYLVEHPYVAPAYRKEVHFFDRNFGKGCTWYQEHFPSFLYKHYIKRMYGRELITGEASVYYMFHPLCAGRIFETIPRVKLIALLRNPIDRAYSHYHLAVRKGHETLSFEDALERERERLTGEREKILADGGYQSFAHRHYSYLSKGVYADQLEGWMGLFPKEQMLVLRSEDLYDDPPTVLQQVLQFLHVPKRRLKEYKKYNSAGYSQMSAATRRRLVDYFAPHNQKLCELVGKDFAWDR